MPEILWRILVNPFAFACIRFKNASKIFRYTSNALLAAVPGNGNINTIYERYAPYNADYQNKYDNWKAAGGLQEAGTLGRDLAIGDISHDLDVWDSMILPVYLKDTPGYLALFPQGRKPYGKTASHSELIAALGALSDNLALTPALSAVKALVDTKRTAIVNATTTQQGAMEQVEQLRGLMVTARDVAQLELWYAYLSLMRLFIDTPEVTGGFFDEQSIRNGEQTDYMGSVAAAANKFIVKRTLPAEAPVSLGNDGPVPLYFWWAASKTEGWPGVAPSVVVAPGTETNTTAGDMFASAEKPYLLVHNSDVAVAGHWEVAV